MDGMYLTVSGNCVPPPMEDAQEIKFYSTGTSFYSFEYFELFCVFLSCLSFYSFCFFVCFL